MFERIILFFSSVESITASISRKAERLRRLRDIHINHAVELEDRAQQLRVDAHAARGEAQKAVAIAAKLQALVTP